MADGDIRILVVDDTVTYRMIVRDVLEKIDGVEVVGTAANGVIALEKIEYFNPDMITLDLEMPELDGLGVLRRLQEKKTSVAAIMISAFTAEGADTTVEALRLGAFDFVLKPQGENPDESVAILHRNLSERINTFRERRKIHDILRERKERKPAKPVPKPQAGKPAPPGKKVAPITCKGVDVVTIGISTGGPQALTKVLPDLPADFPVPILIVQHMPPMFTESLARDLNSRCKLNVSEAVDGQPVKPGDILIAPGGRQMKVESRNDQTVIRVTDDPPVNSCRPAVDYLFQSVAPIYKSRVLGVIMTGMGSDGAEGCRLYKDKGANIICQDEESCVVYGMPRKPIEEGLADVIAPLGDLAMEITRFANRGVALCR